jgi:type II secretory pathway pseudopilin PulG
MAGKGFTLIETLLSLALAVFLIAGTAELMMRAAHLKKRSDTLTASSGLASSKLETLRALPFDSAALAEGVYQELVKDRPTGRLFEVQWTIEKTEGQTKLIIVRATPSRTAERGTELRLTVARSIGF